MALHPSSTLLNTLLIATLWGCIPQASISENVNVTQNLASETSADSTLAASPPLPNVNAFTLDELFEQGAGGCGMSLLQPGAAPGEGFLFAHGMDEEPALMKIDGTWVKLQRTVASGEKFYGQTTSQIFTNEDGSLIVETEVTLGAAGEIESVDFSDAILRVTHGEQTIEIAVEGGAGC